MLGDLASIFCVQHFFLKLILCTIVFGGYVQRQANAILDVEFEIFNS